MQSLSKLVASNFVQPSSGAWRRMETSDLAQVLQIERNTQVAPWSRLAFEESITRSEATDEKASHSARVCIVDERVVGFHVTSSVLDETHILNLAIDPSRQGRGLGHSIMHDILQQAQNDQSNRIFLEVRASNIKAQSLYQKWQFRKIAERKDYYRSQHQDREDALIFICELG